MLQKNRGFMPDNLPTPRRRTPATARQLEEAGKAISRNIVQVTNIMVQKALEGDVKAAEWVASRAFPKTRLCVFELPTIESAADAEKALGCVLAAVAAGKLSVEEGDKLAGTISKLGDAVHQRLIEERLSALEAAGDAKTITGKLG
jgi:hypothetical protein